MEAEAAASTTDPAASTTQAATKDGSMASTTMEDFLLTRTAVAATGDPTAAVTDAAAAAITKTPETPESDSPTMDTTPVSEDTHRDPAATDFLQSLAARPKSLPHR
jgi:hypothetical protein